MTKRQRKAQEKLVSLKETKFSKTKEGKARLAKLKATTMNLHDFLQTIEEMMEENKKLNDKVVGKTEAKDSPSEEDVTEEDDDDD